jgi:hypothetical protein
MSSILKVDGVVDNNYLEQQARIVLAQVDNELNSYKEFKMEIQQDLQDSKDRVDNKFKKAYS